MVGRTPTYDLLSRGRAAARVGEKQEARRYLERLLSLQPPDDERVEGLYWLSEVIDDPVEKRRCLEEVLALNLGDARARRKLAILDGKLKEDAIVDPEWLPRPDANSPASAQARSFTCPRCGARMVYTPDGKTLTCEHCDTREALEKRRSTQAEDFIVAMANGRAQRRPTQVRAIECGGCGAGLYLPPDAISLTCPYCATPHALELNLEGEPDGEVDAPDAIIPFTVDENSARRALRAWFDQNPPDQSPRVAPGLCIYLPAWLFDVGGQVTWSAQVDRGNRSQTQTGMRVVHEPDLLVPATKRIGTDLLPAYWRFDLSQIQPFDLDYLAGWPAETNAISAADAALDARRQAAEAIKGRILSEEFLHPAQNFILRTASMLVESYRLVLLPFWLVSYTLGGDAQRWMVLINGQNGEVQGRKPDGGMTSWARNLLG